MTRLIKGVEGVLSAEVDHNTGRAIVKAREGSGVDEAKLKEAVDSDYKVESVVRVVN